MAPLNSTLQKLNSQLARCRLPNARRSLLMLEVERKFCPTKDSIARLHKNNGDPSFTSHSFVGRKSIKDIYVDTRSETLMGQGIYYRTRNGKFEAKVRKGGDRINSSFLEFRGQEECENVLASAAADANLRLEHLQSLLQPWATMHTLRDEWAVDGFNVVVDSTLFIGQMHGRTTESRDLHVVGEVELCREVLRVADGDADEEMDKRIEAFMKKHAWAFPSSDKKVEGKLTAFGKWRESYREGVGASEDEKSSGV